MFYITGRPLRYHCDDSVVVIPVLNKSTQFDSQFSERWNSSTKSSGTSYGKQLPRTSSTCMTVPAEAADRFVDDFYELWVHEDNRYPYCVKIWTDFLITLGITPVLWISKI